MTVIPVCGVIVAVAALLVGTSAGARELEHPYMLVARAEALIAEGKPADGIPLLERAGRNWYTPADLALGRLYLEGDAVERDVDRAIVHLERAASSNWMRQAYKRGHPEAQHELATIYLSHDVGPYDPEEAYDLLEAAARAGYAESQLALATLYATGNGTSIDTSKAYRWASIARRTGDETVRMEADALVASLREHLGAGADRIEREAARFVPVGNY